MKPTACGLVGLTLGLVLALSSALHGQVVSGSLGGTVRDGSGGVLPDVLLTLTDVQSGAAWTSVSDSRGEFEFLGVPRGSYRLHAVLAGFVTFETEILIIDGPPIRRDVRLELAALAEEVTVAAPGDPIAVVPVRSSQTLFGIARPPERTPRSISVVETDHITRYNMRTVQDVVTLAPGSFTASYFGVPGSLFLRGEPGDNFFRGFRRVENRGNYATPVAASDHIEVVKGPPSPLYGGGKIGGFLNVIPKTVTSASAMWMDRPAGRMSMTYGSHSQKIATAELALPLSLPGRRAGLSVFAQVEDSGSFYRGVYDRNELVQMAFSMDLTPTWHLEVGGQGYWASRPQNIGWNRLTQDLVDSKQYLAGSPLVELSGNGHDLSPADVAGGVLEQMAFTRDMQHVFATDPDAAQRAQLFRLDPSTVHVVTLRHDQVLIDESDFSDAFTLTWYADVVKDLRPGATFRNQTFYDRLAHTKFSSYGFGADYRPWVIENKTSLDFDFKPAPSWGLESTVGGSYRYSSVRAGESRGRGYQVIDRRDLSIGPTPNDRFQGPFNSSGAIPFNYYQDGSHGDLGAYLLTTLSYGSSIDAVVGARFDRFTPDFSGRSNGGPLTRHSSSDNATTYSLSVTYAFPGNVHAYGTYATSKYLELGQGSELDQAMVGNGTYLQASHLYEAGVKLRSLENRVYASAALFRQRRTAANKDTGGVDYFRTTGLEVDARAALHRRISVTGAYTWQRPEQLNIPFLLAIPPALLGFRPEDAYGGRFVGLANIFDIKTPVRVAGQPPHVASLFGSYKIHREAVATLGTTYVAAVNAGYVSAVRLPSYMVWRGSIFHQWRDWSFGLTVDNIFNKEYYQSQYLFWDVFVKPSELRTLSLTIGYRF